jgi:hypothetical protein
MSKKEVKKLTTVPIEFMASARNKFKMWLPQGT